VLRQLNLARGIESPRPVVLPPGEAVGVVAPHPDDELIGCGGTIAKHLDAGHAVLVVMLTSGERAASQAGRSADDVRARREAEALAALGEVGLGPSDVEFLRIPEGGLERASPEPLRRALVRFGADLVYAPLPTDTHRDHVAAARMLAACLRGVPTVRAVAGYEVAATIPPDTVVDIGAQLERKLAGLRRYASALEAVDYVRTAEGLAAFRSVHALHGRGYAEAFLVLSPERFCSLVAELAA
jgi:LmbE family N-acetylglucosaminyl deacetylase